MFGLISQTASNGKHQPDARTVPRLLRILVKRQQLPQLSARFDGLGCGGLVDNLRTLELRAGSVAVLANPSCPFPFHHPGDESMGVVSGELSFVGSRSCSPRS